MTRRLKTGLITGSIAPIGIPIVILILFGVFRPTSTGYETVNNILLYASRPLLFVAERLGLELHGDKAYGSIVPLFFLSVLYMSAIGFVAGFLVGGIPRGNRLSQQASRGGVASRAAPEK